MTKSNSNSYLTDTVVMVRPDYFSFNAETAKTNGFQNKFNTSAEEIRDLALNEFDNMVSNLRNHSIRVVVLPSKKDVVTPDAVFPNNWFSHHCQENKLVIYPLL